MILIKCLNLNADIKTKTVYIIKRNKKNSFYFSQFNSKIQGLSVQDQTCLIIKSR